MTHDVYHIDDFGPLPVVRPTSAPAGSEEKIAVMEERVRLGLPLFHPGDNPERNGMMAVGKGACVV